MGCSPGFNPAIRRGIAAGYGIEISFLIGADGGNLLASQGRCAKAVPLTPSWEIA
jgi:hypothetical protein